jgi:hypothetical protein
MPWPGLAQVFQLERQVIRQKTGEVREERVAGVTSLPGARLLRSVTSYTIMNLYAEYLSWHHRLLLGNVHRTISSAICCAHTKNSILRGPPSTSPYPSTSAPNMVSRCAACSRRAGGWDDAAAARGRKGALFFLSPQSRQCLTMPCCEMLRQVAAAYWKRRQRRTKAALRPTSSTCWPPHPSA